MDREAIRGKFGDDYVATDHTFKMGIDAKVLKKMYGDPKKPNRKTHALLAGKDKEAIRWYTRITNDFPDAKLVSKAGHILLSRASD